MRIASRIVRILGIAGFVGFTTSVDATAAYSVTNLVSDISGLAANTDPALQNPWGVSLSGGSPFWVSDAGSNKATLYNTAGVPQSPVVSVAGGPTGTVFNGNSSDFLIGGGRSIFLFDSLNGQILGWTGGTSTVATAAVTNPGAAYTGLAIAALNGNNLLYAADNAGNKIDVYDSSFKNLNSTAFSGKFVDASLTNAGYNVFNAQTIGGNVYVTYGNPSNGADTATNGGAVAIFDLNGNLIRDFSNGASGPLEDPWGVALAPKSFGQFGGDLLIGNNEQGQINAYDPNTGAFLGLVTTITGTIFNPTSNGLWGLTFGNGGSGGNINTLYAFAGINNEQDGLIVAVNAVPEPGSMALMGIGGAFALLVARLRRRTSTRG